MWFNFSQHKQKSLDSSRWVQGPTTMDSHISEFSYGYALTSELVALFNLKTAGAPEFATQNAEGKKGGGWDLKLPGLPVYLQFKRTARMVRNSAQEASYFPALPFFRMFLHRRDKSDQHELLLDLEAEGNVVAYAAPGFSEPDELNEAYSSDGVAEASIFVRPSSIGPLTNDETHWVAFQVGPPVAFYCSEPHPIRSELPDVLFRAQKVAEARRRPKMPKPESYGDVADELLRIYEARRPTAFERNRIEGIRRVRERRDAPDFARLIAHTLFQCELLVVPWT